MTSNYDKYPCVNISSDGRDCDVGWAAIIQRLQSGMEHSSFVISVECYPGVFEEEIGCAIREFMPRAQIQVTADFFKSHAEVEALVEGDLTSDPVFGYQTRLELKDFFREIPCIERRQHPLFIVGVGASLICPEADLLVYVNLARWEIQQRQRRNEIANFAAHNHSSSAAAKYKRAFFVDWRVADRQKKQLLPHIDFLIDANSRNQPKMLSGQTYLNALTETVKRPFRLVPFFDPGPWGGQWMRTVCDLPESPPNYAWCFDCVPEENSLLLGFGEVKVEVPAIDLVFMRPRELLGEAVYARFGTEFPIRFDLLDTMQGGNLSLQVHPLTGYIQERFGMHYTQDESYYLLDASDDACVYLGLRDDLDREQMIKELRESVLPGFAFQADRHVNRVSARKHDHFLIPAGTIHCSGKNSMVLEISATPYIFTFKLWDWDRLDLNGLPRPIHLQHGLSNIQWDRTASWVERQLINCLEPLAQGEDWREEKTGLHETEFIETRRHWFTGSVPHHTSSGVNVLNLVEGSEVSVESPSRAFEPFAIHYAETFIVPAAVGAYTIRPVAMAEKPLATLKAFVRTGVSLAAI